MARRRRPAQLRPFAHRPGDLGAREIGIEQQPGLRLHRRFMPRRLQPRAKLRRAPVLPNDRPRQRRAAAPRPEADRLALIGDPDPRDPPRAARRRHHLPRAGERRLPDLLRIMLDPPVPRIMLGKLALRDAQAGPVPREQHRPRARRARIDDEDVRRTCIDPTQRRRGPSVVVTRRPFGFQLSLNDERTPWTWTTNSAAIRPTDFADPAQALPRGGHMQVDLGLDATAPAASPCGPSSTARRRPRS